MALRQALQRIKQHRSLLTDQACVVVQYAVDASLSILSVRLITAHLSPDDYGAYRYVLSAIALCSISTIGGLGKTLSSYVAKGYHGTVMAATGFSLRAGLIGVLALIGVAIHSWLTTGGSAQTVLLATAAAVFLPYTVLQRYTAILEGLKKFKRDLSLHCLGTTVTFGATVLVLCVLRKGVLWFGVSQLVLQATLYAVFFLWSTRLLQNGEVHEGYVRHSLTISVINLGTYILVPGIQMYMNWALGPAALAFYVIAYRLSSQAISINKSLMKPVAVRLTQRGRTGHSRGVLKIAPVAFAFGAGLYVVFLVAVDLLGPLIIDDAYRISLFYAKIYGLIIVLNPVFSLLHLNVIFENNSRAYATSMYGGQAGQLVGYVCLIPLLGVMGVIVADVIVHLFRVCVLLWFVRADSRTVPNVAPTMA